MASDTGGLAPWLPWNDQRGRFAWRHALVALAGLVPALLIIQDLLFGPPAAEPLKAATHETGTWAVRFLIAGLAVTPLRVLSGWPRLGSIRRQVGLIAFGFVAGHFALYILDQGGDLVRVASEVVSRFYLTIGFIAVIGLGLLAATSFNAAIRRLGTRWKRLHSLVHVLVPLAILHFFLQSRLDVSEPALMAGLFVALALHRVPLARARLGDAGAILVIAVLAALATALLEAGWLAAWRGAPLVAVLQGNLDFTYAIRPPWWVLLMTAAPLLLLLLRARWGGGPRPAPA